MAHGHNLYALSASIARVLVCPCATCAVDNPGRSINSSHLHSTPLQPSQSSSAYGCSPGKCNDSDEKLGANLTNDQAVPSSLVFEWDQLALANSSRTAGHRAVLQTCKLIVTLRHRIVRARCALRCRAAGIRRWHRMGT